MNSFVQTDRSFSRRAMLWAQRNSWRLPRGVTRAARKLIMSSHWSREREGIVDDWSRPLAPYDSSPVPIVPDLYPTTSPTMAPAEIVRSFDCPHCLIVTQWLDTGGLDEIGALLARRLPLMGFRVTIMWTGRQAKNRAGQIFTALQ